MPTQETTTTRPGIRTYTTPVPQHPTAGECGINNYARQLAQLLATMTGTHNWRAETRSHDALPAHTDDHREIDIFTGGRLFTITHTTPANTHHDSWTVRIGGKLIPHAHPSWETAGEITAIVRSISRHMNNAPAPACATLGCHDPAMVATFGGAWCVPCATRKYNYNPH